MEQERPESSSGASKVAEGSFEIAICGSCHTKVLPMEGNRCPACGVAFDPEHPGQVAKVAGSALNYAPRGIGTEQDRSDTAAPRTFVKIAFSFQGRISRETFVVFYMPLFLNWAVRYFLLPPFHSYSASMKLLAVLSDVFLLWPFTAIHVKRWHDLGYSGWATVT